MGQHMYDNPKPRKTREDKPRAQWHFIDYDMTAMDKEALRSMVEQDDINPAMLVGLVDAGFEVRVKADTYGGGVRAMLIDPTFDESPDQHVLTGRGSTAYNAVCAVLYRHFVVAQEDWATILGAERGVSDFD